MCICNILISGCFTAANQEVIHPIQSTVRIKLFINGGQESWWVSHLHQHQHQYQFTVYEKPMLYEIIIVVLVSFYKRLFVPLYSGERSAGTCYSVAAPKLWNSLPANIRNSRSLDTFKKHLKTHYFKEHFYGI